uniref:Uncharacterized protein n=1 Tax=Panagrolaimus sp. PS1159 TaxID=55785 RepID=A0AC35FE78_9BILA
MILSGMKRTASSSAPDTCDNVENDIESQCPEFDPDASCSDMQDYVNCVIGVIQQDCGNDEVKEACDELYETLSEIGNPCNLTCNA